MRRAVQRVLLASLIPLSCGEPGPIEPGHVLSVSTPKRVSPLEIQRLAQINELENVLRLTDQFLCGGEPKNAQAFATLAELGVKTVVSVDGAEPDLELAKAHGLKYVHIPIGYDGIGPEAGGSLARLASEEDGPIYIHCHHGKHRGPAAAAVACLAAGSTDNQSALSILRAAGTSPGYEGLWKNVEDYRVPPKSSWPALQEVAKVDSLVSAMARIDRSYDNLVLCQEAGWSVPAEHPDIVPAQEALLLYEAFRESNRHLEPTAPARLRDWLASSESDARRLEHALRNGAREHFDPLLKELRQSCKTCHAEYRN